MNFIFQRVSDFHIPCDDPANPALFLLQYGFCECFFGTLSHPGVHFPPIMWCQDSEGEADLSEVDEDEPGLEEDEKLTGAARQCYDLLQRIKHGQTDLNQAFESTDGTVTGDDAPNQKDQKVEWSVDDVDDAHALQLGTSLQPGKPVPDLQEVREACEAADAAESGPGNEQPAKPGQIHFQTLSQLLSKASIQQDLSSKRLWGHLWRLCVFLRCGAGCDGSFIKNHQACRFLSKTKLDWYQMALRACSLVNSERGAPANRISRMQAWKAASASCLNKVFDLPDEKLPECMSSGMVVLLLSPIKPFAWRVALILTVWTCCGKGKNAKNKPTHLPVPIPRVHAVRAVLMEPEPKAEGWFKAESINPAIVCSHFRVAMTLQDEKVERTIDYFKCKLTPISLEVVQKAHMIKSWPKELLQISSSTKASVAKTTAGSPKTPRGTKRKVHTDHTDQTDASAKCPRTAAGHAVPAEFKETEEPKSAAASSASSTGADATTGATESTEKQSEKNNKLLKLPMLAKWPERLKHAGFWAGNFQCFLLFRFFSSWQT